ncbi:hypothetical protein VPH35_095968 [Triticum aestivum]
MEASKLALLVVLATTAAMANPSNAQNSPHDYVVAHNVARAAVGLGPVSWDASVAAYAASYARQRSGDCKLVHSKAPQYGENLFWGSGKDWTAAQAIVWRNSTHVGCARLLCDHNAGVFITCNYSPPGNYIGQRPY